MEEKQEPRECANCGKLIYCQGDLSCWCAPIQIPEPVQDYINASFDGCLCGECLQKLKKELG